MAQFTLGQDGTGNRQLERLTRDSSTASDSSGLASNLFGSPSDQPTPPEKTPSERPEFIEPPVAPSSSAGYRGVDSSGNRNPEGLQGEVSIDLGPEVRVPGVRAPRQPPPKPPPNLARPPTPVVVRRERTEERIDADPNAGTRQGDWVSTSDPTVFLWQPADFAGDLSDVYPRLTGDIGDNDGGDPPIEQGWDDAPVESLPGIDRNTAKRRLLRATTAEVFWSRGGTGLAFSGLTPAVGDSIPSAPTKVQQVERYRSAPTSRDNLLARPLVVPLVPLGIVCDNSLHSMLPYHPDRGNSGFTRPRSDSPPILYSR